MGKETPWGLLGPHATIGPDTIMFSDDRGLLQGTLELLILKTLSWGPAHGYAIARYIEETTDDALKVEEGSLYPALRRMAAKGWIQSEWGTSENNRRAKFYRLTETGEARFAAREKKWNRMVAIVARALQAPEGPGRAAR